MSTRLWFLFGMTTGALVFVVVALIYAVISQEICRPI